MHASKANKTRIETVHVQHAGLKVWVRADSCTGYFCEYDVYTGKGNDDVREFGLGGLVVMKLTRIISEK